MARYARPLGLRSGIGIVLANMIGAGVFLSAGFMAQDLSPSLILLAWVVGAIIALAGARAYAEIATAIPRSGGEYRYLSDLLHPVIGYFAGWASLLVGFAAPIAIDALAAGAFLATLAPEIEPRLTGIALIAFLTISHALGLRWSKWTQNLLVAIKIAFVLGFVVIGLTLGSMEWPAWRPPNGSTDFPIGPFASSLFFIAFAFSGWNAAVYVAEEFRSPRRDVPRAMLFGCGGVALLYLCVNWILIANLTPERARVVFTYETTHITLGHLVASDLLGEMGGRAMSLFAIIAFTSAMSAMLLAGPRVYAAMAADGFLPAALRAREGEPPVGSVILQGILASFILLTHSLRDVLQSIGAVLTLFTVLTVTSLFVLHFRAAKIIEPSRSALIAAAIHALAGLWMLYFGLRGSIHLVGWVLASAVVAFGAYWLTRSRGVSSRAPGSASRRNSEN